MFEIKTNSIHKGNLKMPNKKYSLLSSNCLLSKPRHIKFIILIMSLVLTPLKLVASEYANLLQQNSVNHLQLIVNNLNMIVLNNHKEMFGKKEDETDQTDIQEKHVKFSLTKDNKLLINMFYEAPVISLTKARCQEKLDEEYTNLRKPTSPFLKILPAVSFFDLSLEQSQEMLNESLINVYISAKENKEISTSCNR
jgi:hypothetical protein